MTLEDKMDEFIERNIIEALNDLGYVNCTCGKAVDMADIAWNNACTEAGTDCSSVTVQCAACYADIVHFNSWYPSIDDHVDLCVVIEHDCPDKQRYSRR